MAQSKARVALLVIPTIAFLLALPAHASEISAGFAPGPVWLSENSPTAGTLVRIYTVVYDGSPSAIEGSVSFKIDGTSIGAVPFSLNAGESSIESVPWTASEGEHNVSAEITSVIDKKTKITAQLREASTTLHTFHVKPAPPKTAAVEALNTAHLAVASSSPVIANVIAATTATTESIRKAGETYLASLAGENVLTSTAEEKGSVLGTETEVSETTPEAGYVQKTAHTVLPIFRYPALFYPVFAFIILLIFWIAGRRLRNPKRR